MPQTSGDVLPEHVEAVFREFLGRDASADDVALWMGIGSLRALLDGVLASEEYAARTRRRDGAVRAAAEGPFLNRFSSDLPAYCRAPGTLSPDGVAVVGEGGHLFLYGGTNDNLAMFRGELPMAADWLERWRALVQERSEHARQCGLGFCGLVVPDKLAVYADLLPADLRTTAPRPLTRLAADPRLASLLYPCAELSDARAGGDTYMVTDSHLTNRGNRLLAELTVQALGVSPGLFGAVPADEHTALASGDLGLHFDPPQVELRGFLSQPSAATITADNWPEVSAAGGHIGTRRVFRRDDAADPRTVVVFGDSYGFGDAAYQGLSWFLAQVFHEVHFVWVPFGWDPGYLDAVGAQFVVCQTAERFVARVPLRSVRVAELAAAGGGSPTVMGLDKVFDDHG
jgi:alginate O-acetyltransferase complex protein AlgJ